MRQTASEPQHKGNIPQSAWKKLSEERICFGHRSVGFNILDGIKDLMETSGRTPLKIVETTSPSDFDGPVFAHFKVGENHKPFLKIEHFRNVMTTDVGRKTDIAFFKFCFVDIGSDTSVTDVFSTYERTMEQLKESCPTTKFIHFTVPLTITKTTWKTWIKELMGKEKVWEYDHHLAKAEFNDLLVKRYAGKEPIFDLAKIESTYPDGTRSQFVRKGRTGYSLVPEYTHDGGHLNEKGRRIVAEQLLIFLAELASCQ